MTPPDLLHRVFAQIKRALPKPISDEIRSVATALATPVIFSWRSGHFRSSFRRAAVDVSGHPTPWYTYPAIEFLRNRSFQGRRILEFGGGHSTLWWASRAQEVVTFDDNGEWLAELRQRVPDNVRLELVSSSGPEACVSDVEAALERLGARTFDLVVVDGLWRGQLAPTALRVVAPDGAIMVDNSDGYETQERYRGSGLNRVDFYGYAPGVVMPHCSSLFFAHGSFLLSCAQPIVRPE